MNVDVVPDYMYTDLNIIDEISSGAHEKHIYAGGMHIASNSSGAVEYYHVDHLGSTRLKTAANGSVIYESNYEPFGVGSDESGSEDYRYTGKPEDMTGLYYFGARYYDPDTGRFITRDTVFGDFSEPQSQNRYVYCMNNPHKYTDPDGRWSLQVGVSVSGTVLIGPIGGTVDIYNGGYALSEDAEGNRQSGTYRSTSGGGGLGLCVGLDVSLDVAFNVYDTSIEDVEGVSVSSIGEVRDTIFSGNIGVSNSIEEEGTVDLVQPGMEFSLGLGGGLGGGYLLVFSDTTVYSLTSEYYEDNIPEI